MRPKGREMAASVTPRMMTTLELGSDLTLAVNSAQAYEAVGKLIWTERWDEALALSQEMVTRGTEELDRALGAPPAGVAMALFDNVWRLRAAGAALIAVTGWRGRQIAEFNRALAGATAPSVAEADALRRNAGSAERRRRTGYERLHAALLAGQREAVLSACRELRGTATRMLTWAPEAEARLHVHFAGGATAGVEARAAAELFLKVSHGARESLAALAAAMMFSLDASSDARFARERQVAQRRAIRKNIRNLPDRSVEAARQAVARPSGLFEIAGLVTNMTFDRGAAPPRTIFTLVDAADPGQKVVVRAKHFRLKSLGVCNGAFVRVGVRCRDAGFLDVHRISLAHLSEKGWLTYAIRKAEPLYDLYPESLSIQFTPSPERKEGGGRNSRLRGGSELLEQPPQFRKIFEVPHA